MGKFIDLTGQKFDRLTVIKRVYQHRNEWCWECQCDCGNTIITEGRNLRGGKTRSCGCLKYESDHKPKGNVIDLTGKKFNHLTALNRAGSDKRGEALWECACDCGNPNHLIVLSSNLRSGHTSSCGCERRSAGERKIAELLNENNISYEIEKALFKFNSERWARFDFSINNNEYLIEYDGETHFMSNLHGWHTPEQLTEQQERDAIKNQWCRDNNIPLIRIPYTHLSELCIDDLKLETSKFII